MAIDFNQATTLAALPPDTYVASLTAASYVPRTNSGNPGVKFEFTISDPPEYEGRKVTATKSLQPQALWATKRDLIALGVDVDQLMKPMTPTQFQEFLNDYIGSSCRVKLTNADIQDNDYPDDPTKTRTVHQLDRVLSLS